MSEHPEALVATTSASTAEHNGPLAGVRTLAYAWVGLWRVAAEDLGKFYLRCVVRGEQIVNAQPMASQPEVKPSAPDAATAEPKKIAPKNIRPMSIFNAFGAVESYHFDLNIDQLVPTKAEFDALLERVEALTREVDALASQRQHDS
jgi:polyhydroxyalkanoate synthesis regulator phasin